jgi:Cu/Ag efflux pump CusA
MNDLSPLRDLVVGERGGAPIRLGDIANVEIGPRPVGSFRLPPPNDDAQAVLALRFKSDARLEEVARALRDMARELPPGATAMLVTEP